jgi:hypothetical protein
MKRITLVCLLLGAALSLAHGQKTGPLKSTFAQAPSPTAATLDSLATEAPPNETYLRDEGADIAVSNSADKLFVTIRLDKERDQFRALAFGSTLWLDPKGKKKTKLGVQYPKPVERDGNGEPNGFSRDERPDRAAMMARLIAQKKDMKLIGVVKEEEQDMYFSATNDPSGVRASLDHRDGRLFYHLTLPLALFQTEPGKTCSVGFEIGSFQRPPQSGGDAFGGGMGGMGGRGMGMGGRGMGMGRGGMGMGGGYSAGRSAYAAPKPTRFWVEVELAKP